VSEAPTEDGMLIPWDDRVEEIRTLLQTWKPTVQENNEAFNCREDCVYLLGSLDVALDLLANAAPHLRTAAFHCEDCEGSGEIVRGPDDESAYSEPCANCKPIWDLIKRVEPRRAQPAPVAALEEDDDILF
jgi:hypothetical protein